MVVGSLLEDMKAVVLYLQASKDERLQAEVILSALYNMKSNPKNTVTDALAAGFLEWVK